MEITLNTMAKFRKVNASFPLTEPIRKWKEKGGKVIAWGCNYVPEEIISAAGMLPVRLTGDSKELALELSTAHMTIHACTFARSCLELILKDEWNFLDGFVSCNSCDRLKGLFEHIKQYHPFSLLHQIDLPIKFTPRTLAFYQRDISTLKQKLEDVFGVKITEAGLRGAIEVHNKMRELVKKLYELRKSDNPPIYGWEVMHVTNAAVRMPKKDFNDLMEELLDEIESKWRKLEGRARIMLVGSEFQNPEFLRGIEAMGGLIVIDALRNGARYIWDMVDVTESDPWLALSKRYLNQFPGPITSPWEKRVNLIADLAKEYKVDGVIFEIIRYCSPNIFNLPLVRNKLEEEGIPLLFLDVECGMAATGQVRTRVQAFLEMIERNRE